MGVKLTDLAPVARTVKIRGQEFSVRGLQALEIVEIAVRYPDLAELVDQEEITAGSILSIARAAVPALIAAALGFSGDTEQEAAAATLTAGEEIEIIEAAVKLTMPTGIGPFVEKLVTLFQAVQAGQTATGGKSRSAKRSRS